MVVLAAGITTKTGKALLSRQFVDMTRIRIEGLLAAFPKLIGSGKQHTFVETDNVRYVYHPMETLYLLLITNKASNIMEDLETLRLLSKVVPEYAGGIDEEHVEDKAFELIFAFDEVISMGLKEKVSLHQIKTYTEMDSHEEKLHQMIQISKMKEAKLEAKRRQEAIEKEKAEKRKAGISTTMTGMGSGGSSMGSGSGWQDSAPMSVQPTVAPVTTSAPSSTSRPKGMALGGKGMSLGGKGGAKTSDLYASLKQEDALDDIVPVGESTVQKAVDTAATESVHLAVEEKVTARLNKDGGLDAMEFKGDIQLKVSDPATSKIRVFVRTGNNPGYQFNTHPNINKQMFAEDSILGLKDPSRPFPCGNPVGVLRWRAQTTDENLIPLQITCWPSDGGSESIVNIEYELLNQNVSLADVVIRIPIAAGESPAVADVSGRYKYDSRNSVLEWAVDLIDAQNPNGSMEFTVGISDPGSFFPVAVSFASSKTLVDLDIVDVVSTETGEQVKYSTTTLLRTEEYTVA